MGAPAFSAGQICSTSHHLAVLLRMRWPSLFTQWRVTWNRKSWWDPKTTAVCGNTWQVCCWMFVAPCYKKYPCVGFAQDPAVDTLVPFYMVGCMAHGFKLKVPFWCRRFCFSSSLFGGPPAEWCECARRCEIRPRCSTPLCWYIRIDVLHMHISSQKQNQQE